MSDDTTDDTGQRAGLTGQVRFHYDFLAPFYYFLWGEHVHHGFWTDNADRTPKAAAQARLIHELVVLAGCPAGRLRVLDVGCGYGGALRWFAGRRGVDLRRYLGLTISPIQQMVAQTKIGRAGLAGRARVTLADAQEPWPLDDGDVNLVWCCEMTEHLRDRAFWAREAFRVLEPGGTLCLAAWLAGENDAPNAAALRGRVARDMVVYPFHRATDFERCLTDAGFGSVRTRIVTRHVARTWDMAIALRERPVPRRLARLVGGDIEAFARSFEDLRDAYRIGAMEYGLFAARKPD